MDPKSSNGYRIGIVNPLTLVGKEITTVLRERAFPFAKVVMLDSTGQAAGALTDIGDEPAIVTPVSDDELEDCDLVFFCGAGEVNREWIARYEEDRFIAVDLSRPVGTEEGKLVAADVNLDGIAAGDALLVSPHPVAIPIATILRQLATVGAVEMCTATVVQPASEFDQEGVEELARQTISVLNIAPVPNEVFGRQLAFNLYPAAEGHEETVVAQVRALADARTQLALMITQGTIFHGHTFSLFVRMAKETTAEALVAALDASPSIALAEGDQQFGTIDAAGKDEILIGAVRADAGIERGFWVWAVCDNLRRGSALNAVLVAEKALFGVAATN